jgi:hypothetical protein
VADHMNVIVYLRAKEVRALRAAGHDDPAAWVRGLVKWGLERQVKVDAEKGRTPPDLSESLE